MTESEKVPEEEQPAGCIEQLIAAGRLILPEEPGSLLDLEPLPAVPGEPSLSEALAELRADER